MTELKINGKSLPISGCGGRHSAALGNPGHGRADRDQVRLRDSAVWSLHGTDQGQTPRCAPAAVTDGGSRRGRTLLLSRGCLAEQPSSGATGLDRRTGTAVRLLPIRTNHDGGFIT